MRLVPIDNGELSDLEVVDALFYGENARLVILQSINNCCWYNNRNLEMRDGRLKRQISINGKNQVEFLACSF